MKLGHKGNGVINSQTV